MSAPKACVIGWPIDHSRSPLIHGYWLRHYGIEGGYEKVAVAPDALSAFLSGMREKGFIGANVTIPHKEAAAKVCDVLSPRATRLGVVNTLWFEGDRLHGDTTDGIGFLAALDEEAPGWDDGICTPAGIPLNWLRPLSSRGGAAEPGTQEQRSGLLGPGFSLREPRDDRDGGFKSTNLGYAIVLGAGGAAGAIVDALLGRGMDVCVASRTASRSEALARAGGCHWVEMGRVTDAFPETRLLVNTTPAGMAGHDPLDLDVAALPAYAVVDDIVYVPRLTPLLREAEAGGLRTVGGLGMLLHQAAPGFARWFGITPEVTPALRALVEADIAGAVS